MAALKCLQKASSVSPNNPDIQKEMASLNNLIQKQKVTERELARRMFNGPKSNANSDDNSGKKGQSKVSTCISENVSVN